ncbi:MAG: hypothetical protein A2049_10500 [Elusimicrobia bacterium GWA2_62_23]|nr:MAG: hypothetical protein A2049_10500 [Elusimicrobia bacterium GWA2_62_23]
MKYWFYSEGNILGPYEPAEMLALPAFAEDALVCPETATGDNAGDWRPASQVAEIASALSVGVGHSIGAGVVSGAYEYETGFSSTVRYFEDKDPGTGSYGELLDTIDNILGAYKEGKENPAKGLPETDYDLAEKFDIRLSRIQEELEAARWEKNLLLEKIRMKDQEEKKNRERILDLEARLKNELGKTQENVRELEQVRHLADLQEKAETIRKIEEIKREEIGLKEDIIPAARPPRAAAPAPEAAAPEAAAPVQEKAAPQFETRSLKSIPASSEIKLETSLGAQVKEPSDDAGLTSRKLKSLGQTQAPAYVYGSHYDKPLPGPEAAPAGAFKPENLEPLPQQAGGVVYDFTVVTAKPETSQQFKIETKAESTRAPAVPPAAQSTRTLPSQAQPVKPPTFDFGVSQQAKPAGAPQPQGLAQHGFQFGAQPAAAQGPSVMRPADSTAQAHAQDQAQAQAQLSAAEAKAPATAPAPADSPDKTLRIPTPTVKDKPEPKPQDKPKRKGGKLAFIGILVVFASIAAGGLGYFFLGEGGNFSDVFMLNIGSKKKSQAMTSQLEDKAPAPQDGAAQGAQDQAVAPAPEPAPAPQAQPAAEATPATENIRKALEIVKGYKLSGGRGNIATWFANSFLSGAAGGANEEWTATPLHGDILVVQYRLLRPRQDPLIYQFEVDAAKQDIVRGINNNAIELLDAGSDKSANAAPAPKKKPVKAVRKPSKPREVPLLDLPDAPAPGTGGEAEPTGFENAQAEGTDEVKYLKAQESDEELF